MLPPPHSLTCDLITTTEGLTALTAAWQQLWAEDSRATPFQSPEWLLPWWANLAQGELFTLVVYEGQRPIALLPAFIQEQPWPKRRELIPLGVGNSDYLDAIIAPGSQQAALPLLFEQLMHCRSRWDLARFPQLRPDSPLLLFRDFANDKASEQPGELCYLLAAGANSIKPKMRDNLSYYRRRAARSGQLRVETASPASAITLFDTLVSFHSARWHARGQPGVLSDARVQCTHRQSIPLLARRGLLRLHALTLNDQPIAVMYGFADLPNRSLRRFYCYLTGFDSAWEFLSPGTLLLGSLLDEAARENLNSVDFLRGHEHYKDLWGARPLPTKTLELRP